MTWLYAYDQDGYLLELCDPAGRINRILKQPKRTISSSFHKRFSECFCERNDWVRDSFSTDKSAPPLATSLLCATGVVCLFVRAFEEAYKPGPLVLNKVQALKVWAPVRDHIEDLTLPRFDLPSIQWTGWLHA